MKVGHHIHSAGAPDGDGPSVGIWDALVRERDQLAIVLRISQAAASLDLTDVIAQVAKCFQTSRWRLDYTSLCIHEPAQRALRQHSLFATPGLLPDGAKY